MERSSATDRTGQGKADRRVSTAEDYMKLAQHMWNGMCRLNGGPYEHEQELDLLHRAIDHEIELSYRPGASILDVAFAQQVAQPDGQTSMLVLASWANSGYRQLITSHRLAAALMSTKLSSDVLDAIRPPWPCFSILVPDGLLFLKEQDGTLSPVQFGIVRYGWFPGGQRYGWSHLIVSKGHATIWGFNQQASVAVRDWSPGSLEGTPFDILSEADERATLMFWRLVFGLVLTMQEPKNIRPTKSAKREHNRRQPGPPTIRSYMVGRPPSVDCRQSVIEYVRGERDGGPMTVQTLVCGHWRQQPHGPQSSLRKTIWIEPYWKGPEDAPILVKPRALE